MPRHLADFIDEYLNYTSNTEPAELYRKWTAIGIIAAAMQRKCYCNWRRDTLYPNLYIVLVGPTAARKTTALNQGLRFLQMPGLNVKLGVDSTSRASLIRDMIEAQDLYSDAEGRIHQHSSLTVFSPEFTVFLGYKDLQLLTDLTDWYDSNKNPWVHKTISGGARAIYGVWMNIIGATTPDLLRSSLPLEAMGGGLVGRLLLVFAPGKGKKVAADFETPTELVLKENLKYDLVEISNLGGEFRVSDACLDYYTEWYIGFNEEAECKDTRFAGYFSRKPTTIQKLCMILSASRSDEKVILLRDIQRAIALLAELEEKMYWALQGIGRNALADVTSKVMAEIMRVEECQLSQLMYRFRDDLSRFELDGVLRSLETMKFCQVYEIGGKIKYNAQFNGGIVHDALGSMSRSAEH